MAFESIRPAATIASMFLEDDASYKLLFSAPEVVRDLVLGFIPDEWLHSLDYTTLEQRRPRFCAA